MYTQCVPGSSVLNNYHELNEDIIITYYLLPHLYWTVLIGMNCTLYAA